LSREEISAKFGDDVAVDISAISEEQRRELDDFLKTEDVVYMPAGEVKNVAAEAHEKA
jgi:hypothetical protein